MFSEFLFSHEFLSFYPFPRSQLDNFPFLISSLSMRLPKKSVSDSITHHYDRPSLAHFIGILRAILDVVQAHHKMNPSMIAAYFSAQTTSAAVKLSDINLVIIIHRLLLYQQQSKSRWRVRRRQGRKTTRTGIGNWYAQDVDGKNRFRHCRETVDITERLAVW